MLDDGQLVFRAILADPRDQQARAVFADWNIEYGDGKDLVRACVSYGREKSGLPKLS
jgi:uncharacterized protein (TIGR02996 family)